MNKIRNLRKEMGLTQAQLAKVLNVSDRSVGFYETGERDPDTNTLNKLADFFNVSIDYLLGRTDIRNMAAPADKISESVNDDPALSEFWNTLKDRDDLKLLFKQTKEMSPNDIKKVVRIIKAIEDEEDRNDG